MPEPKFSLAEGLLHGGTGSAYWRRSILTLCLVLGLMSLAALLISGGRPQLAEQESTVDLAVARTFGTARQSMQLGRAGHIMQPTRVSQPRYVGGEAMVGSYGAGTLEQCNAFMRAAPFIPATRDLQVAHAACDGGAYLSAEAKAELKRVADYIATPGKGITACDEGPGTIGDRLEAVGMVNTEENRRAYRQMLFETPGAPDYLTAAILDPETLYQKSDTSGKLFPEALKDMGVMPGVKPHLKVYTLPGTNGETVMQGLDSLAVRLREYKQAGAVFAKWRSPLVIGPGQPSDLAIKANMEDLARYALICQDEGLVPIVEPDVSLKGDHDLETAKIANIRIQSALYKAMLDHGVYMEGSILKVNMVNPGLSCPKPYSVEEIAEVNVNVLQQCMPVAIPGVNYLSGGQNLEDASARLSAMNKFAKTTRCPWNLSFSWSAALQMPLFELCRGKEELPLAEMSELYGKELKIAADAAFGTHNPSGTEGAHVPK
eukprot:gnl/TRDRNA2_/TRDRNA2_191885_c0_seq1.p1 gnl/TRDRNA2_/TRDRNA2_191885_c0~~gnl/TRDRNA2_/TRDRNA2_191885_c0_seq1.p1  ORF type:complete len:489 (+),score=121.41 gnl/TRDRNA2_/TRDRNA2_191885_c0_seq1:53-1519(+)